MDNYYHLTNEQLNQLIHDLSKDSRHKYEQDRLNLRLRGKSPRPDCDAELGINTKARHEHDNWAGLSEDQKSTLRGLGNAIKAKWEPWSVNAQNNDEGLKRAWLAHRPIYDSAFYEFLNQTDEDAR